MTEQSPAEEIRAAAKLMRERVQAVKDACHSDWGDRPWQVTECTDRETGEAACACIVCQGEYKPPLEAQIPLIQYVADAETEEHAAYIASMGPHVGLPLADLLDASAAIADDLIVWLTAKDGYEHDGWGCDKCFSWLDSDNCDCWPSLTVARAYLEVPGA
jgi:hypothetical protein